VQARDFFYDLPPELIAQEPLRERSASRLLVLDRAPGEAGGGPRPGLDPPRDAVVRELPELLSPGDLLVLNDTKVVAARLRGVKRTGGKVEVLLERALGSDRALAQLRASKPIRPGLAIDTAGGTIEVLAPRADLWEVRLPGPALAFFESWGQVPLPPYIRRPPSDADRARYQSVFARNEGAVAAPTASLHFDPPLLDALARRRIAMAFVTLHVGAGTFQPVRTQDLSAHVMHAETAHVSAETRQAIYETRSRGGRVIAVGTTVVRALESAALEMRDQPGSWSGETRLFISPGFRFQAIDGLLTNFHLPESTLLMLVCALAGRERVLAAYAHAVRSRYRFFSYGDAMLVQPVRASTAHDAPL
jgi:S-adenosylmethionine:tRNA ribosyltransferase-isomerase